MAKTTKWEEYHWKPSTQRDLNGKLYDWYPKSHWDACYECKTAGIPVNYWCVCKKCWDAAMKRNKWTLWKELAFMISNPWGWVYVRIIGGHL